MASGGVGAGKPIWAKPAPPYVLNVAANTRSLRRKETFLEAKTLSKRETERQRIRAKLSENDRKFMDELKALFPNSKLRGIRFTDGEQLGEIDE